MDTDGDGVPDGCDACEGFDDSVDADGDGVPDGCDACEGHDDTVDTDGDGVPDGCDICEGHDDSVDTDGDGVPDGCDLCEGYPDDRDLDGDGIPNECDPCPYSDSPDCGEPLDCVRGCAGEFSVGERVRAPAAFDDIGAFFYGTVIAGAAASSVPILVEWDLLTTGHTGNCDLAACGECEPSETDNRWFAACDQIESAALPCVCDGKYNAGDRVIAPQAFEEDDREFAAGATGIILGGSTYDGGSLLIEWDGWTEGHTGICANLNCGVCSDGATDNRWYIKCENVILE